MSNKRGWDTPTASKVNNSAIGAMLMGLAVLLAICLGAAGLIYSLRSIAKTPEKGDKGEPGTNGVCTGNCTNGINGLNGTDGINGTNGTNCPCTLSYAQYESVQPFDNPNLLLPGEGVNLTIDGPIKGTGIVRVDARTFLLVSVGVYRVTYVASITEAAQMALLNVGTGGMFCMSGRTSGLSQITINCLYNATVASTQVRIVNPVGAVAGITLTPNAGGAYAIPSILTIEQK